MMQRWTNRGKKPGSIVKCKTYSVKINDGRNYYIMYKDIFVNKIYHFNSLAASPRIIDCGSNIGMSIIYYKYLYPAARIIAFEPDPTILPYLKYNISKNNLTDVELVEAGVSSKSCDMELVSDSVCGSYLENTNKINNLDELKKFTVKCVRLRDYLTDPVDFLKMNIEGAEWEVLADCEDKLALINEMIIEYHHLPGIPRTLHKILDLLDRNGFEYLINDFDMETNGEVQPPFRLEPESKYFLLIYAKRVAKR
jgi:FkbM family methyltransferase